METLGQSSYRRTPRIGCGRAEDAVGCAYHHVADDPSATHVPQSRRPPLTPTRDSPHASVRIRQQQLLQSLILGIIALLVIVNALNVAFVGVEDSTWRGLGILMLLGGSLLMLRSGKFTAAVALVIAVMLAAAGRQLMETGLTAFGASLLTFTVAVAVAGILLGRRALFITSAISVAWVMGVYLLEQSGSPFVGWDAPGNEALDSLLLFVIVLTALVLVLERFGLAYKRALVATAEREEELRLAAAAAPIGIWSWDLQSGEVDYSPEMKAMFGLPLDARPTVQTFLDHVHPEDRERIEENAAIARVQGSDGLQEMRIVREDGSVLWINGHSRTLINTRGEPVRVLGVLYDVTRDREARERLALLAEAGEILGESLDVQETLSRVARLVVPRLADWVVIDVAGDDDVLERVVVHHRDPPRVAWAQEMAARFPADPHAERGAYHVLRSREPLLLGDVSEPMVRNLAQSDDHYRLLLEAGLSSLVAAPMISRGRPIGVLTLVCVDSPRRYDEGDEDYVMQLAARVAVAVDNARLFQELAELTATLEERVDERTREVQRLAADVTTAEARERNRIARLLHDELQQHLHAAQIMLDGVAAEGLAAEDREVLDDIDEELRAAGRLTRELTTDLSPPALEGDDFMDVVRWTADQIQERHRLDVDIEGPSSIHVEDMPVRALLHSLLQELLFNVVKHSGARRARVAVAETPAGLRLEVADDGRGFDPAAVAEEGPTGFGLSSAADRVRLFGGTLTVDARPGIGVLVTIQLPSLARTSAS